MQSGWNRRVLYCAFIILQFGDVNSVPVLWNSTSETWLEFYHKYCGRVCKGGVATQVSYFECQTPSCFQCDCDPSCVIYGTCCPPFDSNTDVDFTGPSSYNDSELSIILKLPSQDRFFCSAFRGSDIYWYVISDCPPEYLHSINKRQSNNSLKHEDSNKEMKNRVRVYKRCVGNETDTFKDVTPYIDLQYGITFKNEFCARCNGYRIENNVSRFLSERGEFEANWQPAKVEERTTPMVASSWTLAVSCNHYQNLFHITSELQLFRSAVKLGKAQCHIVYTAPKIKAQPKKCDPRIHQNTETTCLSSMTSIQSHCLQLKHKFFRVQGGQRIFCYMCNDWPLPAFECITRVYYRSDWTALSGKIFPSASDKIFTRPHLSLLLGASTPGLYVTSSAHVKCENSSEWRSTEDKCAPTSCAAGKLPDESGLCSTPINNIRGLGYKLFLVVVPEPWTFCVSEADVERLVRTIDKDLSEISQEFKVEVNVTALARGHDSRQAFVQKVVVMARLISSTDDGRDEFERNILRLATGAWVIQAADNTTASLANTILGEDFAPFLRGEDKQSDVEHIWTTNRYNIHSYNECSMRRGIDTNSTYGTHESPTEERLYVAHCSKRDFDMRQWRHTGKFIDITNTLFCPFVTFNFTDISFNGSSVVVHFSYNNRDFIITSTTNISISGEEIRICFDLFKSLTDSPSTESEYSATNDHFMVTTSFLEMICSCLSVLCLLASFVTYCLFPVLRTLPGLNNMCLIISLALAHIFLFITVVFGMSGQLNQYYCLVHAILVHYFWLTTFMWMNACCIHMYRVFTCQTPKFINTSCDSRRHLQYCLFASGSPVVIIVLYVLICMWLTSGSSNGYNSAYCFLDVTTSILTTLLSLVAPLCLTILINGLLFVLTVREMVHVTKLSRRTVDGKGVMIYVKLSTLTGIAYIVCGAALYLHNPVLNLFAAPVMSLQGVFIFMSFICNKGVRRLYSELFTRRRDCSQSSSRSKRTIFSHIPSSKHFSRSASQNFSS